MPAGSKPGERRGGRQAGTKNKIPLNIRELAGRHTEECLKQLINIATKSKIEANRLAAVGQILDRGYGKPSQAIVGDPNQPQYTKIEVSWKK